MRSKPASLILAISLALLLIHGTDAKAQGSAPTIENLEFDTQPISQTQQGYAARLVLLPNQIHTTVIETGDPSNLKIRLSDSMGSSAIAHVAIYLNLHGITREVIDSDTWIIYQKGQPLEVKDPHGFFSDMSAKASTVGRSLQLRLDFTFKNPVEKSDVIIRIWNDDEHSRDVRYIDALEVVKPKTVSPNSQIPVWFKDNAKRWSEGQIDDSNFANGVSYLIKNKIIDVPDKTINESTMSVQIPEWVKDNAWWWTEDIISTDDFVHGIQYLMSQGIISL